MEKNVEFSLLCDVYGNLLTKKQKTILEDYYNCDLSLSEIAENEQITRQAVRDIIKKGEYKLLDFEKKLKIMEDMKVRDEKIGEVLSKIAKLQITSSDKEVSKTLAEVIKELRVLA